VSRTDNLYLGCDPGARGALAIVDCGGRYVDALDLSVSTLLDASEWLAEYAPRIHRAALEQVSPGPSMGRASAMKLGRAAGELRGLLTAHRVAFREVTPSAWQGAMQCRSKGDKRVTLRAAQNLWPDVHMTHTGKRQLADALLLAEWVRRET
jgi:Holliday junction resolvasome RuvABC endonuclease subunit